MIRYLGACVLSLVAVDASAQPVSVSFWYAGPGAKPPATRFDAPAATIEADLVAIRRAGFTGIVTWLNWAQVETRSGDAQFEPVERLISAAARHGLDVRVRLYTQVAPAWASASAATARATFIDVATARLRGRSGVSAVSSAPPSEAGTIRLSATSASLTDARLAFWSQIADGVREISVEDEGGPSTRSSALGETIGTVTRNEALFEPLRPRQGGVRKSVDGAADVEVKLLESQQAIVIIALNRSAGSTATTIAFEPDIPEAIWQNLETGVAVNFVMGKAGPFLQHTFTPRDALVLMIRKTLR